MVDRCYCHDVPFAELLSLAKQEELQLPSDREIVDELGRRTQCGTGCGLCRPYIAVALRTGRDQIEVMSNIEWEQHARVLERGA